MTTTEKLKSAQGLLSVRQLSQLLGSHPMTIYAWVREGKLPCVRVGYRVKFDGDVVADWLTRRAA